MIISFIAFLICISILSYYISYIVSLSHKLRTLYSLYLFLVVLSRCLEKKILQEHFLELKIADLSGYLHQVAKGNELMEVKTSQTIDQLSSIENQIAEISPLLSRLEEVQNDLEKQKSIISKTLPLGWFPPPSDDDEEEESDPLPLFTKFSHSRLNQTSTGWGTIMNNSESFHLEEPSPVSLSPHLSKRRASISVSPRRPRRNSILRESHMTPDSDISRGSINGYTIMRELGQGSFGKVVLGRKNGRLYAIKYCRQKRFRKSISPFQNPSASIDKEIAILKKLEHKHIVNLQEVILDATKNRVYVVLDFVDGGPIIDIDPKLVARVHSTGRRFQKICTPIHPRIVREYLRQIVLGLEYLHESGVIHRDIKPDNLLLDRKSKTVKITDFGVSDEYFPGGDITRETKGTPLFTAPEMCSNTAFHAYPTDIWALGITIYVMIFGCFPFHGTTIYQTYHDIKSRELDFPRAREDIDQNLRDLLSGMLSKDPFSRYTINTIRNHDWVTHYGQHSLLPKEVNCYQRIISISEQEMSNAFTPRISLQTLVRIRVGLRAWVRRARANILKQQIAQKTSSIIKQHFDLLSIDDAVPIDSIDDLLI